MSMYSHLFGLEDDDLEIVIATPKRIHQLWGSTLPPSPGPSLLARLFGGASSTTTAKDDWRPSETPMEFGLADWDGIHFLLNGSAGEGEGPLAFILNGGRSIDEDMGCGPARGFTSAEVKTIDAALQNVDSTALFERASPAEFMKAQIHPPRWDNKSKEECIGPVIEELNQLKKFISDAAQSGRGLVTFIG